MLTLGGNQDERTHHDCTKAERRTLRESVIVCLLDYDHAPDYRQACDELGAMLERKLGAKPDEVFENPADQISDSIEDKIGAIASAAAWDVAEVAYRALFSHIPALYMSDAETQAYDKERKERDEARRSGS